MNFSTTDLYRFFPSRLEHFPDRSARWLLMEPENVRALVTLVAEQIAALLDFSQLAALNRDFLSDTLARNGGRNHVSIYGRSHISTRHRTGGNSRKTDSTPEAAATPISGRS